MSVIKMTPERRGGPWIGAAQARPSRRALDPEPLFEPESPPYAPREEFDPYQKKSASKKALAAFGVALIFLAGLGAGWSVGWSGSKTAAASQASSVVSPSGQSGSAR